MNIKSLLNFNIMSLVKRVLNLRKKIDKSKLPSQGLFYKKDFEISIKKANVEDIIEYEFNFEKENIGSIIQKVKKVVENNIILNYDYIFDDLKSVDIIFIFLEIVKFTKNKSIDIIYFDEDNAKKMKIEFDAKYFNYYILKDDIKKYYNESERCFDINGYKYTLPSIGVENSLTNYLIYKLSDEDAKKYNNYSFDFTFFLSHKRNINFNEIENLIQIFNFDLDFEEKIKIKDILNLLLPMQKYSLIKNGKVIDINSKIDLEKIWK